MTEPKLKNFIVTVDWGDEFPAYHFFQARSLDELEHSDCYIDVMEKYPAGLEMTFHCDIDAKTFNHKLAVAKQFQEEIGKRNKRRDGKRMKAFESAIKKHEKAGEKLLIADWNSGKMLFSKNRTQKNQQMRCKNEKT